MENYVGSHLTSEWYKRNFNILSNIQRAIEPNDKRVIIIMGTGHTSLLEDYIDYIPDWSLVDVSDILK